MVANRQLINSGKISVKVFPHLASKIQRQTHVSSSVLVLYMDDCLVFACDDSMIDSIFSSLSKKYLLRDKGKLSDFLGIHISWDHSNQIQRTQPGLIKVIIKDISLHTSQFCPPSRYSSMSGILAFFIHHCLRIPAHDYVPNQLFYMKQQSNTLDSTYLLQKKKLF